MVLTRNSRGWGRKKNRCFNLYESYLTSERMLVNAKPEDVCDFADLTIEMYLPTRREQMLHSRGMPDA